LYRRCFLHTLIAPIWKYPWTLLLLPLLLLLLLLLFSLLLSLLLWLSSLPQSSLLHALIKQIEVNPLERGDLKITFSWINVLLYSYLSLVYGNEPINWLKQGKLRFLYESMILSLVSTKYICNSVIILFLFVDWYSIYKLLFSLLQLLLLRSLLSLLLVIHLVPISTQENCRGWLNVISK